MNSLSEIASQLNKVESILLTCHIMPDGDSIGSLLGLGLPMLSAGFNVTMFSADEVPERYKFLQGTDKIVTGNLPEQSFAIVVALDCSDHLRLKPIWEQVKDSFIINIDHHPTNSSFGNLNYVDATAAATGEIVHTLLGEMRLEPDLPAASALYVAISTDTGSFKFESTTTRTHEVAAQLLAAGVNPKDITPLVFDLRPRRAVFILREALTSLKFSQDGKIAWMVLTDKEMKKAGARDEDLDGIVNFAKNIEDVEVGLLFREKADGTVKVGFRSHRVDVSSIAKSLGGGGHARAAGCSLESNLETALQAVLTAVDKEV
ncbi:MAG: bifunctional oligoribonuclease/PAP phosphatase NrnA [Clostridiales bacterium]|nr:bifunctional oligoribonuclease/PAP phosphatase NrnA [Clostridiales bacterium]